jgi:hypothetical protein
MSRRLPFQEGFERLLVAYAPHVARERYATALRENRVQLYCDGNLLPPAYIVSATAVVIEQEPDGRWRCKVVPAGPGLGFDPKPNRYLWEVDADGVATLLPPAPRRRGRKSGQNWTDIVDNELKRLRYNGSPLLNNLGELYVHIEAHLKTETGSPAKNLKRLHKRIRDFVPKHN